MCIRKRSNVFFPFIALYKLTNPRVLVTKVEFLIELWNKKTKHKKYKKTEIVEEE